MFNNEKIYTIRTSTANCLKIYLNHDSLILGELINDREKSKTILKKKVVDYSLYVDEKDKIHIIYLNSTGQLNYISYPKYMKDINILTVDEGFTPKPLNIKFFQSNAHIEIKFYHKGVIHIKWKKWNNICHKEIEDVLHFKKDLESYIALEEESKTLSIDTAKGDSTKITEVKESHIEDLLSKIKVKDKNILHLKDRVLSLEKDVNSYNNMKHNYEASLHKLKEKEVLMIKRWSEEFSQYEKNIRDLKEEKDKLRLDTDLKINSLLKIIEEKNDIISRLYKLVIE